MKEGDDTPAASELLSKRMRRMFHALPVMTEHMAITSCVDDDKSHVLTISMTGQPIVCFV